MLKAPRLVLNTPDLFEAYGFAMEIGRMFRGDKFAFLQTVPVGNSEGCNSS